MIVNRPFAQLGVLSDSLDAGETAPLPVRIENAIRVITGKIVERRKRLLNGFAEGCQVTALNKP